MPQGAPHSNWPALRAGASEPACEGLGAQGRGARAGSARDPVRWRELGRSGARELAGPGALVLEVFLRVWSRRPGKPVGHSLLWLPWIGRGHAGPVLAWAEAGARRSAVRWA